MSSKEINGYYNTHKDDITKKLSLTEDYDFAFTTHNNIDIVEIYLDGKLKLKAEYNVIGMYNVPMSIWYWSWNIAFINRKLIKHILPLKGSVDGLIKKYNKKESDELHYILSNDNFYISGDNIEKILKFVLFKTNGVWYMPVKYITQNKKSDQMDRIEYILITKILQFD